MGYGPSQVKVETADGRKRILAYSSGTSDRHFSSDGELWTVETGSEGYLQGEQRLAWSEYYASRLVDCDGDGFLDLALWDGATQYGWHAGPDFQPVEGACAPGDSPGDLDGDGLEDAAGFGNRELCFSPGLPDGSLGDPICVPASGWHASALFNDLNGDGREDVAAVYPYESLDNVAVFILSAEGGFEPERLFPVGRDPNALAAADLNGDGFLDLVTANSGTEPDFADAVSVLLNDGAGSFEPAESPSADSAHPGGRWPLLVADLNGDERPDLVTAKANYCIYDCTGKEPRITVQLGVGDGTFSSERDYPAGHVEDIEASDLDEDGLLDLVFANAAEASVGVLFADAPGEFAAPFASEPLRAGESVACGNRHLYASAHFDSDGNADLLALCLEADNNQRFQVLLGLGDGRFREGAAFSDDLVLYAGGIAVDDLDGDGAADLLFAGGDAGG
ncbi:MAG: VCBS repeat-containing protein, partial [Candidatus Methylomirabilis sp.]|nr:VCBS repeat-containing protein [Deltaproteobacteria bacterium]